ncbi:MAG: Branched-chain amino acid transport [Clostridia bacterium 62_21]|nr:MAG: Branched-chain amino acid transport [Clostridia bacterium 62_21]
MDKTFWIIFGMAVVTYLPRALPLVVLSKIRLPEAFVRWLGFVPASVLAALLGPELLLDRDQMAVGLDNYKLMAALPCFWVAVKTKNMVLTILLGLAVATVLYLWT